MDYRVVITDKAKSQLDDYVRYIAVDLKNPDAARAILGDAEETKNELSLVAGSLQVCDNPRLKEYEYRKILFRRHRYLMLYRLVGSTAVVDAIYHQLQDYENIIE